MTSKIKQDLNRSGWETTDFPSVCEDCLPDNPYVQMLKEDYGAECKICNRPYTLFRWKADKTSRQKMTSVCLTCARLKNCCQCCMRDLSFGLSIPVRDAALKMLAPGPTSEVNKQWYAQEHEKEIEDGKSTALEAYTKTDEKARDLLRRLARSEPYRRKDFIDTTAANSEERRPIHRVTGPIRTRDSNHMAKGRGRGSGVTLQGPPSIQDIKPPADQNIASLFITGVEDDLPEHEIRTFFAKFGTLRSVVVSHRSHCGYINYQNRQAAEVAAEACQGKAIIAGCPLRIKWGKPRKLDSMDEGERRSNLRDGRSAHYIPKGQRNQITQEGEEQPEDYTKMIAQAPPGADDVNYASLAGN